MLNDIIEEYDINGNFSYLLGRYANYLERNGKWNNATNPKHSKCNWTSRMKRLHNDEETEGREFQRFLDQIEKWKNMDQKQAERTAKKLQEEWEQKYNEAMKIIAKQKIEIEQLKEMNIQLEKEKQDLFNKYDSDYESDDDIEGDDI